MSVFIVTSEERALRVLRRQTHIEQPQAETVDMFTEDGCPVYDQALDFSCLYTDDTRDVDLLPIDQRMEIYRGIDLGSLSPRDMQL